MSDLMNERAADQGADAAAPEDEAVEESPMAVWTSVGLFVAVVVLGSGCIGFQMFLQ